MKSLLNIQIPNSIVKTTYTLVLRSLSPDKKAKGTANVTNLVL